jgi:4-amino-4-deoxychorismate lyase
MEIMTLSFVDEQALDIISIYDRGLAYGDGCFTTALILNGKVTMLDQHLTRLKQQSERLGLPEINTSSIAEQMCKVSQGINKGVVKVIVTCGSGGRGYSRIGANQAQVIVSQHDYPNFYSQWQKVGITVGISEQQLGINPMLAGLKHLNRLEQVFLRKELDQRPEDDLLVTDINGHIIECCSANVFWLKDGQWHTPTLSSAGVSGLMRAKVLALNKDVLVGNYTLTAIDNIDAMFISNAILGIVPVKIFNLKVLDISLVEEIQKQCLTFDS